MLNNKGFTIIELMIVIMIIGILAAVAIPAYMTTVTKTKLRDNHGWSELNIQELVSKGISLSYEGDIDAGLDLIKKLTGVGYTQEEVVAMFGGLIKTLNPDTINKIILTRPTISLSDSGSTTIPVIEPDNPASDDGDDTNISASPTVTQISPDYSYQLICVKGYEYEVFKNNMGTAIGIVRALTQDYEGIIKFKTCF